MNTRTRMSGLNRRGLLAASVVGLGAAGLATTVADAADSAQADTGVCGRHPAPPPASLRPGGTFDQQLATLAAQDQFSGTALLVYRNKPVLARAYGMADKANGTPNRLNTIFAMASVTKLFTATAIIQLVERGAVQLDQTLGTYLDGFPADVAEAVTVHQLLTHTSGMGDFLSDPDYLTQHSTWTTATDTMNGIMAIIAKSSLLFTPGTRYSYSNSGYATLGAIVGQVTGHSYAHYYDYIRDQIFSRAGMTRSDFYTQPQWLTDPNIAHPYSSGTKADPNPGGQLADITGDEDFIGNPAGNAFSTAPDMVRFAQALANRRLLSPTYADLMTSGKMPHAPQNAQPPDQLTLVGYGPDIHIVNDQTVVGHTGGAAGETTNLDIYPDQDWITVILSNYTATNDLAPLLQLQDQLITQHR